MDDKKEDCEENYFFKKHQIESISKQENSVLREFDTDKCDKPVVIVGLDSGYSSVAASYIIDKMKLDLIGDIKSLKLSIFTEVINGVPMNPIRIHGNEKFVVIVNSSKIQIEPLLQNEIVSLIYDFSSRKQARLVITLGVVSRPPSSEPPIRNLSLTAKPKIRKSKKKQKKSINISINEEKAKNPVVETEELLEKSYKEKAVYYLTDSKSVRDQVEKRCSKNMNVVGFGFHSFISLSAGVLAEGMLEGVSGKTSVLGIFGKIDSKFDFKKDERSEHSGVVVSLLSFLDCFFEENMNLDIDILKMKQNEIIQKRISLYVKKQEIYRKPKKKVKGYYM